MRWFKLFMAVCFAGMTGIAFYEASKGEYSELLIFGGGVCLFCAIIDLYDFFGAKP